MTIQCTICNIINKSLKSFIVYEDDFFIAFLDVKPLFIGHCLLAPKQHIHTIYDFPTHKNADLLGLIQKIGKGITNAVEAEGSFIAINNTISQSIDHLHIHLVPRNKGDGLKGFFWPRTTYKNESHICEIQMKIKKTIEIET